MFFDELRERWVASLVGGQVAKGHVWRGMEVVEKLVPCYIWHIYGAWRSKEVGRGGSFKVIIWEVKKQRGRPFLWGVVSFRHNVIILGIGIPFFSFFFVIL